MITVPYELSIPDTLPDTGVTAHYTRRKRPDTQCSSDSPAQSECRLAAPVPEHIPNFEKSTNGRFKLIYPNVFPIEKMTEFPITFHILQALTHLGEG